MVPPPINRSCRNPGSLDTLAPSAHLGPHTSQIGLLSYLRYLPIAFPSSFRVQPEESVILALCSLSFLVTPNTVCNAVSNFA